MEAQVQTMTRERVTEQVDNLIASECIPSTKRETWIRHAMADETVLNDLRDRSRMAVTEIINESGQNLGAEFQRLNGAEKSQFWNRHGDRIRGAIVTNANTIPAGLKRDAVAQSALRAFSRRLAPITAFSTLFSDVRLEGSDKLSVPYVPLVSASSTSWDGSSGYVMADQTLSAKDVTLNKRFYQPVRWTSTEFHRQPFLAIEELSNAAAEKLAYDVFVDALSIVTAANFSTAVLVSTAANFDSADVAKIRTACNQENWPELGRSLILDPTFEEYLLRDPAVITAANIGSDRPIREGSIGRLLGFDLFTPNGIPGNSEYLVGLVCHKSSIVFGSAPIRPTAEVRDRMTNYDIMKDAQTGIILEYRSWGDADLDQSRSVIECNYGYNVGNSAALKRITTQ